MKSKMNKMFFVKAFLMRCSIFVLALALFLGMTVPTLADTIFLDDFTGPDGASLDGRVLPSGGGTWVVEMGSATLSGGHARIEDQIGMPGDPICEEPSPPPHCTEPFPGQVKLTLDQPLTTDHTFQITVIDYDPSEEGFGFRSMDTTTWYGAWRVDFDGGNGVIVLLTQEPWFVVVLPVSQMKRGNYTVTVHDVNFSTQTYALDVVGTFAEGDGVSASAKGLPFESFPYAAIGSVGVVSVGIWEPVPRDGVLIDDVRLMVGPTELTVNIDIKPGSFPNSINPNNKGVIPVAILTTDTFDAASVDSTTVLFGATGTEAAPVHSAMEDVDGDGDIDMILHFSTQSTGIKCGDSTVSLTGKTKDGQEIEGTDSISTVRCK